MSQFADLRHGRLSYQIMGPHEGRPLVLVHGLTTPSFVWRDLVPLLAEQGYRVIMFDHFGRGHSDRPKARYDYDFYVQTLEDLLDHLCLRQPVDVLGYSMGGGIAPVFAAQHPERVRRLIVVAPIGFRLQLGGFFGFCARSGLIGDGLNAAFGGAIWRKGARDAGVLEGTDRAMIALQCAQTRSPGFGHAVLSSLRHMAYIDLTETYQALSGPVHAIFARNDAVIPLSGAEAIQAACPQAQIDIIDAQGHGLVYTGATQVAACVAARAA